MIYIDSNIFLYAILDPASRGEKARGVIKAVREGETNASTSYLTFDEVFWKVQKEKGFENALIAARALLEMPNLRFIDVDRGVVNGAMDLIKKYRLHPRDALHASSAMALDAQIVSEDKDFDRVKEVRRKGLFS
jgi:predicted nucleic acid-binding protein